MAIVIKAFANSDATLIVWHADRRIDGCLGFAIHRQQIDAKGKVIEVVLENRIGFQGDPDAHSGAHKSSTEWPVQRFMWSDYGVAGAGPFKYCVVARIGKPGKLTNGERSGWSAPVIVGTGKTPGFDAYFNRGIIPSQWVARALARQKAGTPSAELQQSIRDPKNSLRAQLGGALRKAMLDMLSNANKKGLTIYLALYELNDPELIDAICAFGKRCNLLLGSGAYKKGEKDENAKIRRQLKRDKKINVFDRIVSSPHFAHNKFVVFCDKNGRPLRVWSGSTNWTVSGLCTQINNGILIESPELAQAYLQRWQTLRAAHNTYPPNLAKQGATPARAIMESAHITAWNAPTLKLVDLSDARRLIQGARQGVLFLFFNPGPKGTLLNDILALQQGNLFVHGVVNQDPGGKKAPVLTLHDHGNRLDAEPEAVLPTGIKNQLRNWFADDAKGSMVMIHSKVVLIDPFGPHPVLMTGSHNLGPKASGKNDDNLVIIENAPALAAEYAVHIMGVFDHYKFRYAHATPPAKKSTKSTKNVIWGGLTNKDTWQDGYSKPAKARAVEFFLGGFAAIPQGARLESGINAGMDGTARRRRALAKRSGKLVP